MEIFPSVMATASDMPATSALANEAVPCFVVAVTPGAYHSQTMRSLRTTRKARVFFSAIRSRMASSRGADTPWLSGVATAQSQPGAAPAETRTYGYDAKGRLISDEGSRTEPSLPPRNSLETFDFDAKHLGVLVGRNRQESAGSTTFAPQTWSVPGNGLDGLSRPDHVLTQRPQTVPIHGELSSHAMVKLGARDRAQLVVIAYQTGLVSRR